MLPSNAVRVIRDASGDEALGGAANSTYGPAISYCKARRRHPRRWRVREGDSNVNESMITGETRPVKHAGDHVIAGTVNGEGSLRVVVTGTGDRTALARSAASRAGANLALAGAGDRSRAAFLLTLWRSAPSGNSRQVAGRRRRAGLRRRAACHGSVIACPHALGLAVPLVIAISTTLGARNGLLVRDRKVLRKRGCSMQSCSTRRGR